MYMHVAASLTDSKFSRRARDYSRSRMCTRDLHRKQYGRQQQLPVDGSFNLRLCDVVCVVNLLGSKTPGSILVLSDIERLPLDLYLLSRLL